MTDPVFHNKLPLEPASDFEALSTDWDTVLGEEFDAPLLFNSSNPKANVCLFPKHRFKWGQKA